MTTRFSATSGYWLGVTLIMLLSGLFRLTHLGTWSFWTDEIATLYSAQHIFERITADLYGTLLYHPTTSLLMHIPIRLFGPGEWSARIAPALIGTITAPILYFQVKSIFNRSVGLIAALLLAVSPWHIYWSQNARFYVLLLLLYTIATLAFYHGIEKDKPGYVVLSLLFLGLSVSERLFGVFLVPVIVAYLLIIYFLPGPKPPGLRWRNLALIFVPGLIIAGFFAWDFILAPGDWMGKFGVRNTGPIDILIEFVRQVDLGVIGMGLLGGYLLLRARRRIGVLLLLNASIPILLVAAASTVQFAKDRYAFLSLSSWIILAAYAAYILIKETRKDTQILAMGALAILLFFIPLKDIVKYHTLMHGGRDNLRAAYQFLVDHKQAGDLLVSDRAQVGYYYLREPVVPMREVDAEPAMMIAAWQQQRTWFLIAGSGIISDRLYEWISAESVLLYAKGENVRIYLYEP